MSIRSESIIKILIYSPAFYPSVGGVESVVGLLAEGLCGLGCDVRVATTTRGKGDDAQFPYDVIRSPSPCALLALVRWCDVLFQQNVSLKGLWPLAVFRRRFVVAHHGLYGLSNDKTGWKARVKLLLTHFSENIAVSRYVADGLGISCNVITNPYRDDLFIINHDIKRDRDLVFLGRLVTDKGCDLLLEAIGLLAADGIKPNLTIIGNGPEKIRLQELVQSSGLANQVTFAGILQGVELVNLLNQHTVMVIPSRWEEPFGVVALEGIACGCGVIASSGGGLQEAVGACGTIFPSGNARALAESIKKMLSNQEMLSAMRREAPNHLASHTRQHVAGSYLAALQKSAGSN